MDRKELDLFLMESRAMQAFTSTHVLTPFREDLQRHHFVQSSGIKWKSHGDRLKTAGRVVIIHTPPTKSGRRVMFLTLEDEAGLFDLTVFEDIHARYAQKILGSSVLLVEGIVHRFGLRGVSVLARRFWLLREFYEQFERNDHTGGDSLLDKQDPDKKRHLFPEPSSYRGRPAPPHLHPAKPAEQIAFFFSGPTGSKTSQPLPGSRKRSRKTCMSDRKHSQDTSGKAHHRALSG